MTPGRKFSISTSTCSESRFSSLRPSSVRRSTVTHLRFLPCRTPDADGGCAVLPCFFSEHLDCWLFHVLRLLSAQAKGEGRT